MKINIKPLSVNEAWKGRRFKTDKYKKYERDLLLLLPECHIPDGNLKVIISCGMSNMASDVDNILKPFIDVLQKRYGFNDSRIYEINVCKNKVKKGLEYIDFQVIKS